MKFKKTILCCQLIFSIPAMISLPFYRAGRVRDWPSNAGSVTAKIQKVLADLLRMNIELSGPYEWETH